MNIERLFQVLVVTGASSAGLVGCGGDSGTPSGTGGHANASGGASQGDGGAKGDGGSGATGAGGAAGSGAMCDCHPNATVSSWIDCGGCCCWLAPGQTTMIGTPICGVEPCCAGKGPGR